MGAVPAQTRGFLFSDLRGYSAYTERHGDRTARELLSAYRRVVRDAISAFGGAEIRTEGDSFYVVFDSVSQAVEAGLAIQAKLTDAGGTGEAIQAGIGVHAGEVEDDAEQGIVSSAVNIAARICAVAQPGELLVSDTVRSLTRTYLDVGYAPRGRRKLKGIREPVRVYRVVPATAPVPRRAGLRAIAPALAVAAMVAAVVVGAGALGRGGPTASHPGVSPLEDNATQKPALSSALASTPISTDSFPNAAEEELLDRLPGAIAETCVRADTDEIPQAPERAFQAQFFPALAAARCRVTPSVNAFFFTGSGASAPETTLFYYAGLRGISQQACEGGAAGVEQWSFGPARGWVLCGRDAFWTYDGSNILGRAIGPDMDITMRWWRDNARFPGE